MKNSITDWTGIRHTDEKAVPIDWSTLRKGACCVLITNGSIRGASVSGYFQVADVKNPHTQYGSKHRIQVECHWYGKKPKTCWMNITVTAGGWSDQPNYGGLVISNIGK